jgi:hypothetical protein
LNSNPLKELVKDRKKEEEGSNKRKGNRGRKKAGWIFGNMTEN